MHSVSPFEAYERLESTSGFQKKIKLIASCPRVSVLLCPKIAAYLLYVCQGSAVQSTFMCRGSVRHITTEGRTVSVSLVVAVRSKLNGSSRHWIKFLLSLYLF
jgi:hypothetical protein